MLVLLLSKSRRSNGEWQMQLAPYVLQFYWKETCHHAPRSALRLTHAAAQPWVRGGRYRFTGPGNWSQCCHFQPGGFSPPSAAARARFFGNRGGAVAIPWRKPRWPGRVFSSLLPGFRRFPQEEQFLRRLDRLAVFPVRLRLR